MATYDSLNNIITDLKRTSNNIANCKESTQKGIQSNELTYINKAYDSIINEISDVQSYVKQLNSTIKSCTVLNQSKF